MKGEKTNLYINGKSEVPGGLFDKVGISGDGRITSDIECEKLKVRGIARIIGDVKAAECRISGKLSVDGETSRFCCEELKVSGTAKIAGDVKAETCHVSGHLTIKEKMKVNVLKVSGIATTDESVEVEDLHVSGKLTAESLVADAVKVSGKVVIQNSIVAQNLSISGACIADKSIQAEEIEVSGQIKTRGAINAETVRLEARSGSIFEEIGASKVEIRQRHLLNIIAPIFIRKISGGQIEADQIYIEHADIRKISGHDIVVGPECEIEEIEYTGTLEIDKKSTVKQHVKI